MFDDDFSPEDMLEFNELYMVQSHQMICKKLSKKGIRIRQYKYTEFRAS